MQSVAYAVPQRNHAHYIKCWDVVGKIARAKEAGNFEQVISDACSRVGTTYTVRPARKPGTLARLLSQWPNAANDQSFSCVDLYLQLAKSPLSIETDHPRLGIPTLLAQ
jgi:hypothetical protein